MVNRILVLLVSLLVAASFSAVVSASLTVSVSSPKPVIDVGQNTTYIANVTGGNGNYTCQWFYTNFVSYLRGTYTLIPFGGTQCSVVIEANSTVSAAAFSIGSDLTILANINDSVGDTVSGTSILALYPSLNVIATPSASTIYVNNSVTLSSYIFGGRPQYSWSFFEDPTAGVTETGTTSNGIGSVTTFYFTQPGVYNITEVVSDLNNAEVAVTTPITVLPAPQPVTVTILTPPSSTFEVGQNITLSAQPSGGVPPYTYSWFVNNVLNFTSTNSGTFVFVPTVPGTYTIYGTVSASNGGSSSTSNYTVVVHSPPTIVLSPASSAITAGKSLVFSNVTSNGVPPYSYSYSVPNGVVQNGNGFTFPNAGNYTITETVVDSLGYYASSSAQVSVGVLLPPPPPYAQIYVNGEKFDLGQTVPITGTVFNLVGPYTYNFSVISGVINRCDKHDNKLIYNKVFSSITTNSYAMSYKTTKAGVFYSIVTISNNTVSVTSPRSSNFTVYRAFSLDRISPKNEELIQGQKITLRAAADGGSGVYAYQWLVKAPGSTSFVPIPGATKRDYTFATNSTTPKGSTYEFIFNATDIGITNPITLSDPQASITVANTIKSGKGSCSSGGSGSGDEGDHGNQDH